MSAITGLFTQYERDELNKITAKAILEKLMNTRQKIDLEFTARRLIWELIQNAKDNVSLCNHEQEKVSITVEITNEEFIFSHNKGYFTNEHVRGLIRKYSSSDKERDFENIGQVHKATGRFGTGFMTTHLLSEQVKVTGYYKNEKEKLTPFGFWLKRDGKNEKDIVRGINDAFNEAEESIRNNNEITLEIDELNTVFTYPLSAKKKMLAQIAFEEVREGIAYTLINVPEIESICLVENLLEKTVYTISKEKTLPFGNYSLFLYNLIVDNEKTENYYVTLEKDNVQIIVPVSYKKGNFHALQLAEVIPRLHLDFPMIGTEDLNIPFIINSPLFEPTEPRDGVSLINDDENEVSQLNCKIVIEAVELYKLFLSYIDGQSNWKDLYNLARIKHPKKHSWIDSNWYNTEVVDIIRTELLHSKIVQISNSNERTSIWDDNDEYQVFFPHAKNKEIRNKLWKLVKKIYPQSIPIKEQIDAWDEIIWKDCYSYSISQLSEDIDDFKNIEALSSSLNCDKKDTLQFLNEYYELLNLEGDHIKEIAIDKFSVIPNQQGDFKKKSELYIDGDIDEEIKEVCSIISQDPREYLLEDNIHTGEGLLYHQKDQEEIITEINNIIKEGKSENLSDACDYLTALFPVKNISEKRRKIFEFSKQLYPDDFTQKRKLHNVDDKLWEESDKQALYFIVKYIADQKNVDNAIEKFNFSTKKDFLHWLDSLITFLVKEKFENNINRERNPILPNQNGIFCSKEHLFLDDGSSDEVLKNICNELGYDFRDELLDPLIFLELPENRTHTIVNIAEKISAFIKPILRDVDKRKQYKSTLRDFYIWMSENSEKAELYFFDLYEKRFFFLEDEDISKNMKKATDLDELMEEHGIVNVDDLRNKLNSLRHINSNREEFEDEKIDITQEVLASLGISSSEELKHALQDPAIASRFFHSSTPTTAMFFYAQELINRSKENIIAYLGEHPDYDCNDLEETAPTVLAGIVKNGIPIQVVTRPSDNGEVIIYYSSEKDILDSTNAELWVDNGITDPHILTLGRILKSTGINRIPIKMD